MATSGRQLAAVDFSAERRTKADDSRDKVMAAGARVLAERGYAGTTMRAVGEEAGLKAGSLYYHFKSKAELVAAVLEASVRSAASAVNQAIATLPPSSTYLDRLNVAIRAHLQSVVLFHDFSIATRRVFGQVPQDVRRKHIKERNQYGQVWIHLLEAARDAGEIRADIDVKLNYWFILGALNSAAEWHHPETQSLDAMADELMNLVLRGMKPGERSDAKRPALAKRRVT